jgi:hypothetical protein
MGGGRDGQPQGEEEDNHTLLLADMLDMRPIPKRSVRRARANENGSLETTTLASPAWFPLPASPASLNTVTVSPG